MSALNDIQNSALRKALGNFCLSKIALEINAGGAATVKSTGDILFAIDGVAYTHAALSDQAIGVTHDFQGSPVASGVAEYLQPALSTVYYLLSLNAAGTLAVSQGTYLGQAVSFGTTSGSDLAKILTGTGAIPAEPDGYTAIGLLKVETAGVATFNPATTALDAADVTVTYVDLSRVPSTAP